MLCCLPNDYELLKMRFLFTILLLISGTFLSPAGAAAHPAVMAGSVPSTDSTLITVITALTPKTLQKPAGKKPGLLQKLQIKLLQHKLKKALRQDEGSTTKATKVLSVISMVSSGLALVLLIAGWGVPFLILTLAGIITGIIALSNNNSRKHRTMAVLGLVVGGINIILAILAVLIAISFFGAFWAFEG